MPVEFCFSCFFYGSMVENIAQHLNKIIEMEYKLEFMYQIWVMHCKDRSNYLRYPISRKYSSAEKFAIFATLGS